MSSKSRTGFPKIYSKELVLHGATLAGYDESAGYFTFRMTIVRDDGQEPRVIDTDNGLRFHFSPLEGIESIDLGGVKESDSELADRLACPYRFKYTQHMGEENYAEVANAEDLVEESTLLERKICGISVYPWEHILHGNHFVVVRHTVIPLSATHIEMWHSPGGGESAGAATLVNRVALSSLRAYRDFIIPFIEANP